MKRNSLVYTHIYMNCFPLNYFYWFTNSCFCTQPNWCQSFNSCINIVIEFGIQRKLWKNISVYSEIQLYLKTRRLENNSTHGRPRSANSNIGWAWPFQIVIRFMVHYITLPNFRPWCDYLIFPHMGHHQLDLVQDYHENVKVPWNEHKMAALGHI